MEFTSLDVAQKYLDSKVADFRAQTKVIADHLNAAYQLYQRAITLGDTALQSQLAGEIMEWQSLRDQQASLEARLDQFYPKPNLGLLPLAILAPAIAIPLAVLLYNHLSSIGNHKKTLELIEKGMLTAEQARGIQSPSLLGGLSADLQTIAMIAAGGFALYLFWPMLVKQFRRS
jgi:hypothetical protein